MIQVRGNGRGYGGEFGNDELVGASASRKLLHYVHEASAFCRLIGREGSMRLVKAEKNMRAQQQDQYRWTRNALYKEEDKAI